MKKWTVAGVNAILLALGIFFAVFYTFSVQSSRDDMSRDAFVSTVEAMKQVSLNYLDSQQDIVNAWGSYIEEMNLTVDEAVEFLKTAGTDDESSFQLVDVETMTAWSSKASVVDPADNIIDYSIYSEEFKSEIKELSERGNAGGTLCATSAFVNPVDGQSSIGFGTNVTLTDESGGRHTYFMMGMVLLTELQKHWVFPTGYEDAEIGMITSDGEYIIRTSAMKSENFFEFIRAYNDLTYPEKDEIQAVVEENDSGVLEYKNARGEDSYWVYTTIAKSSSDWRLVGYVPVSSLKNSETDWTLIMIVCALFVALMIVDGAYLLGLNKKLRESAEAANQASEAKTRFLSSMSHDIRTPMNAITGMTSIAKRHIDDKERVSDCLSKIELASDHLLTLINDVLDISRIESGKLVMNPAVFSLPDLMTNLANMVRPQIHEKNLLFNIRIYPLTCEYLYADKLRLNQIFINILSNAIKYTPEGGTVTLTMREQFDKEKNTARLEYTVEDTGIGMTQEFIKTIFQPFTRAIDTRVDTIEGAGLGLAITKQMIDAMDGDITVESEVGKGSTFSVTLELQAAEKEPEDGKLPDIKVLVADDDPVFLESVTDTFEVLGVEAETADGGADAVSMAVAAHESGSDYAVIILDWKMPEVDGVAAAAAIRKKVGEDIPIIILSAFDWSDIEEQALAVGVSGFINKPVFRSTLYDKVVELLGIQQAKRSKKEEIEDTELRGMHLLLAEDNDMNWEIAVELLKYNGISADRAKDGAECVKMLEEAPEGTYEIVLMDIQMPVMNGWDAARRIRKSEIPYVKDIPIIAMTADAFAEDIATSMEAGMNGHVSKPIDMKLLLDQIKKAKNEVNV